MKPPEQSCEKTPILLFGSSGHAKVVADVLRKQDLYRIAGIVQAEWDGAPATAFGAPVMGMDADIAVIVRTSGIHAAIIATGDNFVRQKIADNIRALCPELQFPTAIHPSAQIGDEVVVGQGTVIMAGTVVNSGTRIGDFCIVNSSASVDHDNCIEDFASLAPGVVTGGNVTVRRSTAIGLGAHLSHGVEIGPHAVIGAGAVVLADIPGNCVAYGVPARVARTRQVGERYL